MAGTGMANRGGARQGRGQGQRSVRSVGERQKHERGEMTDESVNINERDSSRSGSVMSG